MADTFRVNGNIVAISSYILAINGIRYYGISEFNYRNAMEITPVYGMQRSGTPVGTTPGKYVCDPLKLKVYQTTADAIKTDLYNANPDTTSGLSGFRFPIGIQYHEVNSRSTYLDFYDCRLVSETSSITEGAEASMTELEFFPLVLVINNQPLFRPDNAV
jgi:hypothetical protein